MFNAAREDYAGGYLFDVQALVSAEILDDALAQAETLLHANLKDPACVVAGVALETALKKLATRHGFSEGSVDRMNNDLMQQKVYNVAMHKQIGAWYARRNDAAHGNWTNYNQRDVADMINGVRRFVAEQL